MRFRPLPLFLLLLLFPAGARSQTNSSNRLPDGNALRRQADAVAAKWNAGAKLYLAELNLLLGPNGTDAVQVDAQFYYFVGIERGGETGWLRLTVSSSSWRNPPVDSEVSDPQLDISNPRPTPAPTNLVDPLPGLQNLYGNGILPPDAVIRLVQIGNKNLEVIPDDDKYGAESTGDVAVKFGRPGEWVWYTENPESTVNRLTYVDAITGQGSMICASAASASESTPIPCPSAALPRRVVTKAGALGPNGGGSGGAGMLQGEWQGTLLASKGNLPLLFHLSAGDSGTVDSPAQKFSAPLQYTANGNQITITVSSINANYAATVNGNQMSGTWSQNGRNTTLTVTKQSQPGSGLFNSQGSQRVQCNEQGKNCRPVN